MLPHNYIICLLLANVSPLWFKIINPLAEAANNNKKVPRYVMKDIMIKVHLSFIVMTLFFSYLYFFAIGFNKILWELLKS